MFLVEGTHASLDSLVVFSTSSLFANELDFVVVVHAAVTSIFVRVHAISQATKKRKNVSGTDDRQANSHCHFVMISSLRRLVTESSSLPTIIHQNSLLCVVCCL